MRTEKGTSYRYIYIYIYKGALGHSCTGVCSTRDHVFLLPILWVVDLKDRTSCSYSSDPMFFEGDHRSCSSVRLPSHGPCWVSDAAPFAGPRFLHPGAHAEWQPDQLPASRSKVDPGRVRRLGGGADNTPRTIEILMANESLPQ